MRKYYITFMYTNNLEIITGSSYHSRVGELKQNIDSILYPYEELDILAISNINNLTERIKYDLMKQGKDVGTVLILSWKEIYDDSVEEEV
jgi:hypothetical protein